MKAFPLDRHNIDQSIQAGMELRDYFAAKAMEAFIQKILLKELDEVDPLGWMDGLSADAYEMADAMLEARRD